VVRGAKLAPVQPRLLLWISALALGTAAALEIARAPYSYWNGLRLVAPVAWAWGQKIFFLPGEGPAISGLNGPVQALLYSPAAWASTPAWAVRGGVALSLLFVLGPLWLLCRSGAGAAGFWAVAALAAFTSATRLSLTLVHSDAPALGLTFLALRRLRGASSFLCVLAAVAAVHTKASFAPVLIALPLWILVCENPRAALRFAAAEALALLVSTLLLYACFGEALWAAGWAHAWQSPKARPFWSVAGEYFGRFGPALAVIGYWVRRGFKTEGLWLFLAGLFLPAALYGRWRAGGDENTLTPSVIFILLGVGLGAVRHAPRLAYAGIVFLSLWVLSREIRSLPLAPTIPMDQAFFHLKQYPGKTYFPFFPLSHLMTEGKIYHSWEAVQDLSQGVPFSSAAFFRFLPEGVERIAFLPDRVTSGMAVYFDPPLEERPDASLPGWRVFHR